MPHFSVGVAKTVLDGAGDEQVIRVGHHTSWECQGSQK